MPAAPPMKFDVHPGVQDMQNWIAGLKAKTGRTLDEWISLVRAEGPADEAAQRDWLKTRHGLGTNASWWIAERARENPGILDDDPESYLRAALVYVEGQYAGKKARLRPIFEALVSRGRKLGRDVKVCPCKTIVPLYREHVFAQIKPTTNSRIDLGLALAAFKGKLPARIIDTGGREKKDRITHRIPLESADQIDAAVEKWLKTAYDLDAPSRA